MAQIAEIHVDDVGTRFELSLKEASRAVDLSAAAGAGKELNRAMYFRKPDGTILTLTGNDGVVIYDAAKGKISYVTKSGDVDQAGLWRIQAWVKLSGTEEWFTSVEYFQVLPNILP